MARNDIYVNINATSPANAIVVGQQDMTAADIPELVLGDTPTFNFYFTDNTNVWPSWAGNAAYSVTWALSDAVSGDISPAAVTGNATPITGGWSIVLPLNSYDLVGLLNTKRISQPYPVQNLWQQIRVTAPDGKEVTRALVYTPIRYRAISDTQNTESASPTGGRFVATDNTNALTTPTAAQFYAANPVPASALPLGLGNDTAPANGELLIGNGTGYQTATLTGGDGITITNGAGSITIDASVAQGYLNLSARNGEAVAITRGQAVYVSGAQGSIPEVKLADADSDLTSQTTIGLVADASINSGAVGTIRCVGEVKPVNTGSFTAGDVLYLSSTPGQLTNVKPQAPIHMVQVGICEKADNNSGEIYVFTQNGYELDELHNVQINAPKLAGQTLIYDNTLAVWKNARLTAGTNIAVANADGSITLGLTGQVAVANGGTGASDAGTARTNLGVTATGSDTTYAYRANNLSDLANAGTARTNLGLGSISTQNANNVAITGGAISSTTIGASGASTGAFTTLSASSTVSGTGFSTYLASPPAIGSTAANTGAFTTLAASGITSITNNTASTSSSTGALVVTGGAGIGGALYTGGNATVGGTLTVSGTGTSTFGGTVRAGAGSGETLSAGSIDAAADIGIKSTQGIVQGNARIVTFTSGNTTLAGNLTVSGTGTSSFGGNLGVGVVPRNSNASITSLELNSGALINYSTSVINLTQNNAGDDKYLFSAAASTLQQTAGKFVFYTAPSGTAGASISFTAAATLTNSGNYLLGTTTDGGNGKLQLATHTTSAGGIGFGTDTSYYRSQTGMLALDGLTGSLSQLDLRVGGAQKAFVAWNGGDFYLGAVVGTTVIKSSNTTALTLDASQNATFVGTVKIKSTAEIKGVRTTTATTNFGNISANGSAYVDVTVTGAELNDSVIVNCKDIINGFSLNIVLSAYVMSADTVRVVAVNTTGSTINSVTGTSRISVINF